MNAKKLSIRLESFGIHPLRVLEPGEAEDGMIEITSKVHVQVPLHNDYRPLVVRETQDGRFIFGEGRRAIEDLLCDIRCALRDESSLEAAGVLSQISPPPVAMNDKYAEAIIGDRANHYDAIEIHGVRDLNEPGDPEGTCCEVNDADPQFFSVYVHLKSEDGRGGVECVGDFASHDHADQYAKELSRKFGWPVGNFVEAKGRAPVTPKAKGKSPGMGV